MVEIVVRRIHVFAVGRIKGSFFQSVTVGELAGKTFELVAGGEVVLFLVERHCIVPTDILGVLFAAVVERQILEELGGTGVAIFVVVIHCSGVLGVVIIAVDEFVVSVATY